MADRPTGEKSLAEVVHDLDEEVGAAIVGDAPREGLGTPIPDDSNSRTPEQIGTVAQVWLNDIDAMLAKEGEEDG